tara:strand:+ start:4249 stop:4992 length:744 start_codon:yes stop_codon:yes gene_type:complete
MLPDFFRSSVQTFLGFRSMKRKSGESRPSSINLACPLCQTGSVLFFSDAREYWLCETCRLIFVPPLFHITSEKEVDRYLEHENSLENEGYVNMFRAKINLVREACPKIGKILDYGCGYEPVLKTLLSREGYQVDAFDPNFFPDGKSRKHYDMVISTEAFEHFREPSIEIERILGLLDGKGYIAVMTQFYPRENGSPSPSAFEKWYYKRDPSHIAFYTPETFEWIAHTSDMDIILNNEKDFVIFRQHS